MDDRRFIMICSVKDTLHALDHDGGVWEYVPYQLSQKRGELDIPAYWSQLTDLRADVRGEDDKDKTPK